MTIKVVIAIAGILFFAPNISHAEGGCPPGMIPYQGTNTQSCGPIPSSGEKVTSTGPKWASRWGAIAQDKSSGVLGAVADRDSKRTAQKDAIAECASRGGSNCKVELAYTNQCVVTVQGSTAIDNARAPSTERATQIGMEACEKRGDTDCHVYYKACSLPVQIR